MSDVAGLVVFKNSASMADGEGAMRAIPMNEFSVDYLRARERAERAAAKHAGSLAARHVHQELAQHYAQLARLST